MKIDLQSKTAVVTGGSKGIGYGIAEAMARANANVVISARSADEVEEAARRLDAEGEGRVIGVSCDVRKYEDVQRMIRRTVEEFDGLDILINNAGVGGFGPVDELKPEKWNQVIETNLSGVYYCCHEAIPHIRKQGGGWIINIASLAGKNPIKGGAAYNASKFGLVGFSEALMMDVRYDNIRVNYIMPGSVASDFAGRGGRHSDQDTEWMVQPEDIGRLVMDLLAFPDRALPSRIEIRPSRPPKK